MTKIAAWLGVKDEIELIDHSIEHLYMIGVDHIYACDSGSTDGTRERLGERAKDGRLQVIDFDDSAADAEAIKDVVAGVVRAADASGMDWLLFCDADEFWLPSKGNLKDCKDLAEADELNVGRFNVVLAEDGPLIQFPAAPETFDDIKLFVKPIPNWQKVLEDDPDAAWITGVPVPKIMARPRCMATTDDGHHRIKPAVGAAPAVRATPSDIVIAHVPFSTPDRFARKLENIRSVIAASGDSWATGSAWHWRRWLRNADTSGAKNEFMRNALPAEDIEAMQSEGGIMSVREWLTKGDGRF